MEEYLSVSEFAKLAKVTPQAVYLRLNSDLKDFKRVQGNRTYIAKSCLENFRPLDKSLDKLENNLGNLDLNLGSLWHKACQTDLLKVEKELVLLGLRNENLVKLVEDKDKHIEELKEQLNLIGKAYNKLVESLSSRLAEKDSEVGLLVDKITILFDQQQQLQSQLQAQLLPPSQQDKKSFWQRIFNK